MFKKSIGVCAQQFRGGGSGGGHGGAQFIRKGGNSNHSGGGFHNRRRAPSVERLPNVTEMLRQGAAGGGGGGSGSRRVENVPPNPNLKRPGATSDLFQYRSEPRTIEATFSNTSSSSSNNKAGANMDNGSSSKVTTDAFSFRIGTRFQGFEASPGAGMSSSSPPPPRSENDATAAPASSSSSSSSTVISSEEVQFDSPASSSQKSSIGRAKSRSFELDGVEETDEYDAFLNRAEVEEEEDGEARSRSVEEEENAADGDGAERADEGGHIFNEEEQRLRDEQERAERAAKAIKLRTMALTKQIQRLAPAVRDWHALAASRKKVLVVEMDAQVEVRRDELAPFLPPETDLRRGGREGDAMDDLEQQRQRSATKVLSSTDLWRCSKLMRVSRHARESQRTVVTGGKTAIKRIWKEYGIVPNVIYCPDDEPVPKWCLDATNSERCPIVIRAPGAAINKDLLSAELNDGFAAEFTLGSESPIFRYGTATFSGRSDINVSKSASEAAEEALRAAASSSHSTAGLDPALLFQDPKHTNIHLRAAVFLTESRIPSNVGLSIKAAVDNGYSAIILDRCVDMLNEKVIRASDGTIFNPKARIFQLNPHFGVSNPLDAAEVVQKACLRHNLLPLATVPSQSGDAMPAFQVAQELFYAAEKHDAAVKAAKAASGNTEAASAHTSSSSDAKTTANAEDDRTDEEKLDALALIHRDQSTAPPPQGAMLLLGSEAMGLHRVMSEWHEGTYAESVPFSAVTLEMPDFRVTSINVAVAGGILMRMFRPAARREHRELFRLGVVPEGAEHVNLLEPQPTQQKSTEDASVKEE